MLPKKQSQFGSRAFCWYVPSEVLLQNQKSRAIPAVVLPLFSFGHSLQSAHQSYQLQRLVDAWLIYEFVQFALAL